MGPRCPRHAEELKRALRDPNSIANMLLGRARTEEEIDHFVRAKYDT